MRAIRAATALVVPLAVMACAEQGGEEGAMEGEQAGGQQMAAATGQQQASGATEVALRSKNDSGITGTARLTPRGDSVAVRLSLSGLTEGDSYAAHVHEGRCDAGGGVAVGLSPVTGRADGTGTSTRAIAGSALAGGQRYIQAHLPNGTPAACGDVPAKLGATGADTASGSSM